MGRWSGRPRGWWGSGAAGLVMAAVAVTSGCSSAGQPGPGGGPGSDPGGSARPVVATPSTTATDSQPSAGRVPAPLPNPVTSVTKVPRPGVSAGPSVTAPPVGYTQAVAYPDGVSLEIVKVAKGVEQGHGPGDMAGREYVRFTVRLSNGSAKAINLNQVVVTLFYGASRQLAAPVYAFEVDSHDFGGTVEPGASTEAAYAFAIPATELADVTMAIDFDGTHSLATYRGKVPVT